MKVILVERMNSGNGYGLYELELSKEVLNQLPSVDSIYHLHKNRYIKHRTITSSGNLALFVESSNSLEINQDFIERALQDKLL